MTQEEMRQQTSNGHICWISFDGTRYEWFTRNGDLFRAPDTCVVMPDGYRCGRFEYPDRPNFREYAGLPYNTGA